MAAMHYSHHFFGPLHTPDRRRAFQTLALHAASRRAARGRARTHPWCPRTAPTAQNPSKRTLISASQCAPRCHKSSFARIFKIPRATKCPCSRLDAYVHLRARAPFVSCFVRGYLYVDFSSRRGKIVRFFHSGILCVLSSRAPCTARAASRCNNKECIKYKLSDPISQSLMKKKW